jgi:predicted AlkP superfamily pyrophosphatase or phosphodiesterase
MAGGFPPARGLVALVALAATLIGSPAAAAPEGPPKLVVAISVDQFSANLFDEWRDRFTGGLARLSSGVVYRSGYQTHAGTETCPGHSTLLTGKHPNKTGIVANTYRDPTTGRQVYCLFDPTVTLAHGPKASPVGPQRLMATTLGEWLKAKSPQSRVVSVSGKDRGAITMAGHSPDGVFWLAGGFGFTTYMPPGTDPAKALEPVAKVNRDIADVWRKRPEWSYRRADCKAAVRTWRLGDVDWESRLPPLRYGESDDPKIIATNVTESPMADELTGEGAVALIRHFRLGRGPAPDLLAVSFSATDRIGHRYGTRGPEMCEQLHRLDAVVGRLLSEIDALGVPYLVVLTADHGGTDFTERLAAQGYTAERLSGPAIMSRVNTALMAQFGLSEPPVTGTPEEANIKPLAAGVDRAALTAAAARTLAAQPEMAAAFTQAELLATPIRKGAPPEEISLQERFAMSVYPGRSPDILGTLQPLANLWPATPGEGVAGHGTPWNYDRRVPMLFWWPGAAADERYIPVETVDIAPTLAAALGLDAPSDLDGRCLPLGPDTKACGASQRR